MVSTSKMAVRTKYHHDHGVRCCGVHKAGTGYKQETICLAERPIELMDWKLVAMLPTDRPRSADQDQQKCRLPTV